LEIQGFKENREIRELEIRGGWNENNSYIPVY